MHPGPFSEGNNTLSVALHKYTRLLFNITFLSRTFIIIIIIIIYVPGRDSSVGIATRYGMDGPGIESWWRRDFPHPFRPALDTTQPRVLGLFPGGKAAGAWR